MALIGSGTYDIPNVVTTAVWRSADVDAGLSAIAEQLGGVSFVAGVPVISGGNLTSANFGAGALMGTEYLAQSKHWRMMTFVADRNPVSATPVSTYTLVSAPVKITKAMLGVAGWSAAAAMSGSVAVKVNGVTVCTVTVDDITTSVTRTSTTPSIAIQPANFALAAGDTVQVDFSGLTCAGFSFYDRHVVLMGYSENVE